MKKTIYLPSLLKINFLILVAFIFMNNSFANGLEIINLEHRAAKDIIPIIQPLLDKNGSISGEKHVLFIRTSYKNLQQIKSILPILDAEYRVLRISIIQETAQMMKRYGYLETKKENNNAIIYSTERSKKIPNQKTIQVTEGQWATLQTGVSIPSLSRTKNPDGTITESIEYQSVYTRLKIQPKINGKKIKLQVLSHTGNKETINSVEAVKSQTSGELGEWIALGGISEPSNNTFTFSTQHSNSSKQQLFIKIELTKHQD